MSVSVDPRINERIRAPQVRLVGADGTQVGIVSVQDALERARAADLDLVEVAPQADPPVCRLLDYSKYKYEQEQKAKAARKHQHKVKVTIMFRGREQAHPERGRMLLDRLFTDIEPLATIEQHPVQEGRNMTMLLAPTR